MVLQDAWWETFEWDLTGSSGGLVRCSARRGSSARGVAQGGIEGRGEELIRSCAASLGLLTLLCSGASFNCSCTLVQLSFSLPRGARSWGAPLYPRTARFLLTLSSSADCSTIPLYHQHLSFRSDPHLLPPPSKIPRPLLHLLPFLLLSCPTTADRTFTIINECTETVWPALTNYHFGSDPYTGIRGWEALAGSKVERTVPSKWNGRLCALSLLSSRWNWD